MQLDTHAGGITCNWKRTQRDSVQRKQQPVNIDFIRSSPLPSPTHSSPRDLMSGNAVLSTAVPVSTGLNRCVLGFDFRVHARVVRVRSSRLIVLRHSYAVSVPHNAPAYTRIAITYALPVPHTTSHTLRQQHTLCWYPTIASSTRYAGTGHGIARA
eukprot:1757361-Rhodomonas_salina.1